MILTIQFYRISIPKPQRIPPPPFTFYLFIYLFTYLLTYFLGPYLKHMEVPRIGVELEL